MKVIPLRVVDERPHAVVIDRLTAGYSPCRTILRNVSLKVPQGACWAIVGPSGGGKTTLLRAVLGMVRPDSGEVRLPLLPVAGCDRRCAIGYIPQQLGLVRNMTVRQNVLLGGVGRMPRGRSLVGMFTRGESAAADEALASVGLAGRGRESVAKLSGGERRRVAIARALIQRPQILLADEFLAEVDQVTATSILDLLTAVCASTGMTILCVEHNLEAACRIAERIVVLADGCKVREIDPADAEGADAEDLFRIAALA